MSKSDSAIVVLHEIYGINHHMEKVCEKFSLAGYDIICPNLIGLSQPFKYDMQEEAYKYFINHIGFDSVFQQVKQLAEQARTQYKHVYMLGYSIGATIAWLCSGEDNLCDGIIGYYGSRIRDYLNIIPKCPALLIFPTEERSFDVRELVDCLKEWDIDVHLLSGKHGFADPFSNNYCSQSFEEAERLVNEFLKRIRYDFKFKQSK
jgi:dienelactone hydrolase